LIDTRDNFPKTDDPIKSLTVFGKAEFIEEEQRYKTLIDQLVKKNNNLTKLANDPDCTVIQVRAEKFLLLDGVSESTYINISGR